MVYFYEPQNSMAKGHFVLFNLNSVGGRVTQLGTSIPQWAQKLFDDVIGNFPDRQISNRNYRLGFADADAD